MTESAKEPKATATSFDRLIDELSAIQTNKKIDSRKRNVIRSSLFFSTITLSGTLAYLGFSGLDPLTFIEKNIYFISAFVIFMLGFTYYSLTNRNFDADFVDVDIRRRSQRELEPAAAWPFPTHPVGDDNDDDDDDDDDVVDDHARNLREKAERKKIIVSPLQSPRDEKIDPIAGYFSEITKIFTQRAADADEKASLLLSKGTNYTKGGIAFFIISIVVWQALSAYRGFHDEYIYGMISCTGLFIFIEFLSAWFLKQYRQYVDTATYLLKVKAIFDRYLLAYLAHNSFDATSSANRDAAAKSFIKVLEKEIEWPESYLMKKAARDFAGDATGAVGRLVKEIRRTRKTEEKKSKKTSSENEEK